MLAGGTFGLQATTSPHHVPGMLLGQCRGDPWTSAAYQSASTPAALAQQVLACLKLEDPTTYRHDEVGIVALIHDQRYQNINEFGLTSTVQRDLARLGVPPITLEDGPGGLIMGGRPRPTLLPNELALGATFDPSIASEYGTILGSEAHVLGIDGVQAPDLNLVRVPSWGRAMESFGESPVLAGAMGAAEAVAIASQGEIPVLKHFGPYSQETDRHQIDQLISPRTYQEVYIRPFIMAIHALLPILRRPHHAVGIMCSYGDVNATRACRSPDLSRLLDRFGVDALVRSDLDVWVPATALLENAIDLIKPMNSRQLTRALGEPAVDIALDRAVAQVFTIEFADGLITGAALPTFSSLSSAAAAADGAASTQIEQRAAVLLKDERILPIRGSDAPIAVVADPRLRGTCARLASQLAHALSASAFCVDPRTPLPSAALFPRPSYAVRPAALGSTYTPTATGSYVVTTTTRDSTKLSMNGNVLISTSGRSAFGVQRSALIRLRRGSHYRFELRWIGLGPHTAIVDEQPMLAATSAQVRGARVAVVLACDLAAEGMDRSSLSLPNAQDALIESVAAKVPTAVVLASDGAVAMPWLPLVRGVLEVWNPTGMVLTDLFLSRFATAYTRLLDGAADPSGRLPMTFPVSGKESPMGIPAFWPGVKDRVNLDLPPKGGLGIGLDWYRQARWPVLFPFGFGLSYTSYQLLGGAITDPPTGLQASVAVRDTGSAPGTEVVQLYADWPSRYGEPPLQLVGFAPVTFSASDVANRTVRHVVIPISPDALSVNVNGGLAVLPGSYCIEAATYDGDPHAWAAGPLALTAKPGRTVAGAPTRLRPGTCAA